MAPGRRSSWTPYGDERSGVVAYRLTGRGIALEFRDGRRYLYDHDRPGEAHVARMIELAREGRGLTTYVNQHVRERYARRL